MRALAALSAVACLAAPGQAFVVSTGCHSRKAGIADTRRITRGFPSATPQVARRANDGRAASLCVFGTLGLLAAVAHVRNELRHGSVARCRTTLVACRSTVASAGDKWARCDQLVGKTAKGATLPRESVLTRRAVVEEIAGDGWTRRDQLLEIEIGAQKTWDERSAYEVDAPLPKSDGNAVPESKFFVTFPYPYMNGRLHLGHAFSLTKAEFAARFARLDGKRVLFPFSFHGTGMPIAAAAMKLEKELHQDVPASETEPVPAVGSTGEDEGTQGSAGVFKGSKSKAQAKSGGMSQSAIMRAMDIGDDEISKFTDPKYWLQYFPPLATSDLRKFGVSVDWRRSFITTDMNPYYDAFVRWQFQKLRTQYLGSGNRASIFSIATGQPCADHDRAEGEGVNPMEYTLIKMKVQKTPDEWKSTLGDADIFLVAATLRPETMYGQTNCFVLPEGSYGFFRMRGGEIFVCTERSALNMCYQGLGKLSENSSGIGEPDCVMEVTGRELFGLPLKAPLAAFDTIYVLPMLTISMEKGTGIVTGVPADSPDDYACLNDWKTRANWREQFGIKEDWCQPFGVVETIEIPHSEYGNAAAPYLCEKLKIGSHKEKDKLAEAKKEVYQKGFYSGVLLKGPYAGQKVMDAKPFVRRDLIESGQALPYFEPEGRVVARSGDECVVAMCDQWYLTYSDPDWTQRVRAHVENELNAFNKAAHNNILHAVGWLGDWACSRTFGLGTKLPWDEKWLIESLSDSTIYMAYYTVAHLLQGGHLGGAGCLAPEDLTVEVFDYVFCLRDDPPSDTKLSGELLNTMRNEFAFWYPLDLRCSGKDLIQNHLTMSLFNHAAVWKDTKFWPRAYYCNGHVMVDAEKMSKSKGNFLTLRKSIEMYSADCTRIACADAGDGLEDANFSRETAKKSILRLTTLKAWAEEMVSRLPESRAGPLSFLDELFNNELSSTIAKAYAAYSSLLYSDALREALFGMENLRLQYSMHTNGDMHRDVIQRFLEVQALVLSPIAPHFCEHLWTNILRKPTLVVQESWPSAECDVDILISRKYQLIQDAMRSFRLALDKLMAPSKKGKKNRLDNGSKPTHAVIFVAKSYKQYQQDVLRLLQEIELNDKCEPVDPDFMRRLKDADFIRSMPKKGAKQAMSFAGHVMKQELKSRGREALELGLPFDEADTLRELMEPMKRQLGLTDLAIADAGAEHPHSDARKREAAEPGKPTIAFYTPVPA